MQPALIIAYISAALILVVCLYEFIRLLVRRKKDGRRVPYDLDRHGGNPVLSPLPFREWEAEGAFNPAAITDDESNVHLLYRAIGSDGLSRIGHAMSKSGVHFNERSPYPVFVPTPGVGMPDPRDVLHELHAVDQIPDEVGVGRDGDVERILHRAAGCNRVDHGAYPADPLSEGPGVPGIPSLHDNFDPPELGGRRPGIGDPAIFGLGLDAEVPLDPGDGIDDDAGLSHGAPPCSGLRSRGARALSAADEPGAPRWR